MGEMYRFSEIRNLQSKDKKIIRKIHFLGKVWKSWKFFLRLSRILNKWWNLKMWNASLALGIYASVKRRYINLWLTVTITNHAYIT